MGLKIELSEVNWSDNDKWKLTSDNSPIKKVNFDNYLVSDYRFCAQHWWQTPIFRSLAVAHGRRRLPRRPYVGARRA